MVLPTLIHGVDITIEQIDRSATLYDEDAREPIQHAGRKTQVVVKGQPHWRSEERLRVDAAGPTGDAQGWVTFRYADLDAQGIALEINDRIVKMGRTVTEVYVVRLEPKAQYPDQDGPSLLRVWFSDRRPAKERP